MNQQRERAFGRGKVILLGEHVVVYGVPALAAGLAKGVYASAQLSATSALRVEPWGVVHHPGDESDLGRAFAAVLPAGLTAEVDAEVELPAGSGLGCSAALGVAVVRALAQVQGVRLEDREVATRAFEWERVFHGAPSGIDNTMAAHGGIALYQRGEPLAPLAVRRPLTLVIGNSGEPSSTREMVALVARQRERDPARFEKTCEGVASLVRNAKLAIEDYDVRAIGQLMDLNQHLLSSLMLSTPAIEEMIGVAREAGAAGAKLTGSGGGGCMIALVEDAERAQHVQAAIAAKGFEAFTAEAGS